MPGRTPFLDTGVFDSAAGRDRPFNDPSRRWLESAAVGDYQPVTGAKVLQELLHVLIRWDRRE